MIDKIFAHLSHSLTHLPQIPVPKAVPKIVEKFVEKYIEVPYDEVCTCEQPILKD